MGPVELPAWLQPRYRKNAYLFIYYLIQFCGHSWIFTNMTVRFFSFGKDSVVDTFYAIGLVMRLCQSVSLLELLHIYVGIESDHLLPRLLQLTERIIILFVVITSQEEVQEKYVARSTWNTPIAWNELWGTFNMVKDGYSRFASPWRISWTHPQTLLITPSLAHHHCILIIPSCNLELAFLSVLTLKFWALRDLFILLSPGSRTHVSSINEGKYKLFFPPHP
ncbi:very-long-chain (3R)-3-hydroxyacyl-CoA dehydratase 4 isoform 2-T5 [Megaptera novaeangliae]